jgi:hypothetical protein
VSGPLALYRYLAEQSKKYMKGLSAREIELLRDYQEASDINHYLRNGLTERPRPTEYQQTRIDDAMTMDRILAEAPRMPEPRSVYRAAPSGVYPGEEKGFLSTSFDRDGAGDFLGQFDPSMDKDFPELRMHDILIPEGTPHLALDDLVPEYAEQRELLFPRGGTLSPFGKSLAYRRGKYAGGGPVRQILNSSVDRIMEGLSEKHEDLAPWINTALRKYMVRDMGTDNDPVVQAVRDGATVTTYGNTPERMLDFHQSTLTNPRSVNQLARGRQRQFESGNPDWLSALPDPNTRLGGLVNLYLRRWSSLGDEGRRYTAIPDDYNLETIAPEGLRGLVDTVKGSYQSLPKKPGVPEGRMLGDLWREYATQGPGIEELTPKAVRTWAGMGNGGHSAILRGNTSALRQMAAHDPATGAYEGTKYKGRVGGSGYHPFGRPVENYLRELVAENPYLAKFDPDDAVHQELKYAPGSVAHMLDALTSDLGAGRLRPESLNHLSVRDAAWRTDAFNREIEKRKEEDAARKLAEMLTSDEGRTLKREYPEGWRWDQITNSKRAMDEACAAGATWCFRDKRVADNYLKNSNLFVLRDPSGKSRVAVEQDPDTKAIRQVRNRKQSGVISEDAMPFARDVFDVLGTNTIPSRELDFFGNLPDELIKKLRVR